MDTLYLIFLSLHNILRWVVVVFAVLALVRAYRGWLGKRTWSEADRKAGSFFTIAMDTQLLVGLTLYFFLSPISKAALSDFGGAMGNASLRFFGLEHAVFMLMAVVFGHLGSALAKRAGTDEKKFRTAALWFTLAVLVLLLGIPWPFGANIRPWFRLPF